MRDELRARIRNLRQYAGDDETRDLCDFALRGDRLALQRVREELGDRDPAELPGTEDL